MNLIDLYRSLDATHSTLQKVEILTQFFVQAPGSESSLGISVILGNLPKKLLKTAELKALALEFSHTPLWLFEECYSSTGDLAETLSLLCEKPGSPPYPGMVHPWLLDFQDSSVSPSEQIQKTWTKWDSLSLLVLNKLLTGSLRIGVARGLLIRALARASQMEEALVAQALVGTTHFPDDFLILLKAGIWLQGKALSSPYPFALASPWVEPYSQLGDPRDWLVEWKWDGIRAQWILRQGVVSLWSRGEELLTERFPELTQVLPQPEIEGVVLDGEILAWDSEDHLPLPFQVLQTRIGRKKLTPAVLKAAPISFFAYDCLEFQSQDVRAQPLSARRELTEQVIAALRKTHPCFELSTPVSSAPSVAAPLLSGEKAQTRYWDDLLALREEARARRVEGFILKRKSSSYFHGRKRGDWWKSKIDPMTLDAALIYAQAGHGKRSNLFTDYTFALKAQDGSFVPVAKAYSGLTDLEIGKLDHWIRKHTVEKFGPVRSVPPFHVFELAFENIAPSPRHKSGIALRFPRILRWRTDKPVSEIDELEEIKSRFLTEKASLSKARSQSKKVSNK